MTARMVDQRLDWFGRLRSGLSNDRDARSPEISSENVSAVLVTRGDVDLNPILKSLPYDDVVVWDNTERPVDLKAFGRYLALYEAKHDVIFFQDDDTIFREHEPLMNSYRPGKIVANMPPKRQEEYPDAALLGWGSLFHRSLPWIAFDRYLRHYPFDDLFFRLCDHVFPCLTPCVKVNLGFIELPQARDPSRTFLQPKYFEERDEIRARAARVRKLTDK